LPESLEHIPIVIYQKKCTEVDKQHSEPKSELSNDHEVRIFEIPGQLAKQP
jgi:hypothetical protein